MESPSKIRAIWTCHNLNRWLMPLGSVATIQSDKQRPPVMPLSWRIPYTLSKHSFSLWSYSLWSRAFALPIMPVSGLLSLLVWKLWTILWRYASPLTSSATFWCSTRISKKGLRWEIWNLLPKGTSKVTSSLILLLSHGSHLMRSSRTPGTRTSLICFTYSDYSVFTRCFSC